MIKIHADSLHDAARIRQAVVGPTRVAEVASEARVTRWLSTAKVSGLVRFTDLETDLQPRIAHGRCHPAAGESDRRGREPQVRPLHAQAGPPPSIETSSSLEPRPIAGRKAVTTFVRADAYLEGDGREFEHTGAFS
ncbi:hypothetical protein [Candidatus Palauibacter sp.]|uniref:hypothetical protein n=1 Tax=Candidatus Palauibacter sp. TaxID=3101350 RepID=UPI003C6EC8DE